MKNPKMLIVVITVLSFTETFIYSQKINWGQAINQSKDYSPIIMEEDGNVFYTYTCSAKELILEKFEKKNSNILYSKKYEIPKDNKAEIAIASGNKIMVLFSFYNTNKKISEIYCNTYSSADGVNTELNHTIASVQIEKSESADIYQLYKSFDNKRILITYSVYSEKEDKYTMHYILLDQNLAKLFEKSEITDNEVPDISGMILDNDGSFYFQKHSYGDSKTKLVSFDANKLFEEYEYILDSDKLNLPKNGRLGYSNIAIDKNGDIVMVGQYLKDNTFFGYSFIKINPKTKLIILSKITEFNTKLIDQFLTQRQIKKGKKAIVPSYLSNMQLIAKDDGGIVGITDGAQYIRSTRTTKQGLFTTSVTVNDAVIYYDVMAINFSSDGTLLWANRIPRYQSYSSKRIFASRKDLDYLSYFSALTNNKLYVAYHDKPSNVAITSDNERIYGFRMSGNAVTTLFTIDLKTGQKDKRLFTEGADLETFAEPGTAYQKSQNSDMIILGSKNKKFKYGVMSFPK